MLVEEQLFFSFCLFMTSLNEFRAKARPPRKYSEVVTYDTSPHKPAGKALNNNYDNSEQPSGLFQPIDAGGTRLCLGRMRLQISGDLSMGSRHRARVRRVRRREGRTGEEDGERRGGERRRGERRRGGERRERRGGEERGEE